MTKGFDAVVGNPPWVLYAGKGKQPIDAEEEAFLKARFERAASTLSTHGCFASLAGRLVREQGRVGLVLPTSMADASRYAPARAAHEQLCEVEPALPSFGEHAFVGVFQPSFGLVSTRRQPRAPSAGGKPWGLEQGSFDAATRALLAKLSALPRVPAELFGERGFRSSKADEGKLRKASTPCAPWTLPLFEGVGVRELQLGAPTAFADPSALPELASPTKWSAVALYVRQTARFPIACRSAGLAFRNSVLAGFARGPWTAGALAAFLSSAVVRWFHVHKQRDAREGMPQVKIGHLRALPCPAPDALAALDRLGTAWLERDRGIDEDERARLADVAADGLGLDAGERERVWAWALANPPPESRQGPAAR